jgi:hypothetical protein
MAEVVNEQDSQSMWQPLRGPLFSNYFLTKFKFSSHYRMLEFVEDVSQLPKRADCAKQRMMQWLAD